MSRFRILQFLCSTAIFALLLSFPGCGGGGDDDNTNDDNSNVTEQCATPTFSPVAGTYTSDQAVTITTTTSGATIYYTTDGTDPSTSSSVYSSAISISGDGTSVTIKAIAVASGMDDSEIASGTFTIAYEDTTPDPPDISSITIPADSVFGNVVTDTATDNAIEQDQDGTAGADKIVQYGGNATTHQYAYGNDDNDWILQQGGDNTIVQQASADNGDDTIYQFAGSASTAQAISGGDGIQTLVQVGSDGADTIHVQKGYAIGNSTIQQYGGAGNDAMTATGGVDDDTIAMYGGTGSDTMTYNLTDGEDDVTINGGDGDDAVTINMGNISNITLEDAGGNVLYTSGSGDTTVTVSNIEDITVNDSNGDPVYESN